MTPEPPAAGAGAHLLSTYRGRGLPREVKALGLTSLLQDVASEMVYPLLPRFLLMLGGGPVLLGAMESAAQAAQAVVKGAAGRWSDRAGRRKPFVSAGYGLSAAIRPLMAIAGAAGQVVGLRMLDRLAKGLRTAPRDALIAESTPPARHAYAFAFHRGLDHLGAALGPLAAFLVLAATGGSLRWAFAAATLPALAGWLVVMLALPAEPARLAGGVGGAAPTSRRPATARGGDPSRTGDSAPPGSGSAGGGAAAPMGLPRSLRRPLTAFFLFSLGNASDAFLLLRAGQLGYSPADLTLLWSGFHLVKWLVSAPAGRLADRLGARRPIVAGWLLYAVVYLGFARVTGAVEIALLFVLYALFYGLTEGAERALVVERGGRADRRAAARRPADAGGQQAPGGAGTALGAFHFATDLGVFFASLLFGLLWTAFSPATAFVCGAALALAAALVLSTERAAAAA